MWCWDETIGWCWYRYWVPARKLTGWRRAYYKNKYRNRTPGNALQRKKWNRRVRLWTAVEP